MRLSDVLKTVWTIIETDGDNRDIAIVRIDESGYTVVYND